jgi:hypothetical protein
VYLVELTAFGTTLAMNFLTRGTFTGDKRRPAKVAKVAKVESKKSKVEKAETSKTAIS